MVYPRVTPARVRDAGSGIVAAIARSEEKLPSC